jgi:molecular chaperone GrpE
MLFRSLISRLTWSAAFSIANLDKGVFLTVAKKKQEQKSDGLSAAELAEIEELTENFGPEIEVPAELQDELDSSAAVPPPEEAALDALGADLAKAREEARNSQELYLRALAEMDNLRKRQQREKEDIFKFGNENILREILPVVDNLERAVEHATTQEGVGGLLEGVQMTLMQFSSVLKKFGVEVLNTVGEPFDPAHHQAMGQVETLDVEVNHVAQEMQKGYLLNNRLLRPAMVMVAKEPRTGDDKGEVQAPVDGSDE